MTSPYLNRPLRTLEQARADLAAAEICGCGKPLKSHFRGLLGCPTNGSGRSRLMETEKQRDERMIMEAFPETGLGSEALRQYGKWKQK